MIPATIMTAPGGESLQPHCSGNSQSRRDSRSTTLAVGAFAHRVTPSHFFLKASTPLYPVGHPPGECAILQCQPDQLFMSAQTNSLR